MNIKVGDIQIELPDGMQVEISDCGKSVKISTAPSAQVDESRTAVPATVFQRVIYPHDPWNCHPWHYTHWTVTSTTTV